MFARRAVVRRLSQWPNPLRLSPEVAAALRGRAAVVALESTVITHGLPPPHNLEVARAVELAVRENGAVPATVALLDGRLCVGLEEDELERLATSENSRKVSIRDLAACLTAGAVGGTTVAATMHAAHLAGIRVFATGGIGGVHRDFEQTLDMSADLQALGRTPVAVVCAGIKSILDVPKTLEYLESQGVPVIVYGETAEFPGFFSRRSGSTAPYHTTSIEELATMLVMSDDLRVQSGAVLACPCPEETALDSDVIEAAVQAALVDARDARIGGKQLTPFLLDRIRSLTGDQSLRANRQLLINNASIAAKLAVSYVRKRGTNNRPTSDYQSAAISSDTTNAITHTSTCSTTEVVVIGATIVDIYAQTNEQHVELDGGTYAGAVASRVGGVGRNHADALTRLGVGTRFVSAIGDDPNGRLVRHHCRHMDLSAVSQRDDVATGCYVALTTGGELAFGVSQIEASVNSITPELIKQSEAQIADAQYVLLDGNMTVEVIRYVCGMCQALGTPVWYEPADRRKIGKLFAADCWPLVAAISPNRHEFQALLSLLNLELPPGFDYHFIPAILHRVVDLGAFSDISALIRALSPLEQVLMNNLELLVLTLSELGAIVIHRCRQTGGVNVHSSEQPDVRQIVSVSGAGDCFNAGLLAGRLRRRSMPESVALAQKCAALSLATECPVPQSLSSVLS